jgi:hypothetical protein
LEVEYKTDMGGCLMEDGGEIQRVQGIGVKRINRYVDSINILIKYCF